MYERVLEDSLEFPPHFDSVTCEFIARLLTRDARKRLGWGENGAETIKGHLYFAPLDWEDVIQCRLQPDYVPVLISETDLTNFDDLFVNMSPRISIASDISFDGANSIEAKDPFEDFAYDPQFDTLSISSHISERVNSDPYREDSFEQPQPTKTLRKRDVWLDGQNQHHSGKGIFSSSSSSSILSSSVGDIVRHTDTMPSLLSSHSGLMMRPQRPFHHTSSDTYARKRHSAALSLVIPLSSDDLTYTTASYDDMSNSEEEERIRILKKRQTTASTVESSGPSPSSVLPSHFVAAPLLTCSPESSLQDIASIDSKGSMYFNTPRPSYLLSNDARGSHHYSTGHNTRALEPISTRLEITPPYTRPHCPVPGQLRPDITRSEPSAILPSFIDVSHRPSSLHSDISMP